MVGSKVKAMVSGYLALATPEKRRLWGKGQNKPVRLKRTRRETKPEKGRQSVGALARAAALDTAA